MATLGHLLLFFCYAGIAAAGALYLPRWLPELDQTAAIIAGGFLVLLGVLFHEIMTRALNQAGLGKSIRGQEDRVGQLEDELTWTRREVRAMREVLEAVAGREQGGEDGRVSEVMAELRILKTIVGKLAKVEAQRSQSKGKAAAARTGKSAASGGAGRKPLPVGAARGDGAAQIISADAISVIREALRNDRVEMVLQPIVTLPQRRQRAFECFSRLVTPEGRRLLPQQYLALAEDNGLINAIDNMLLFRCIQLVRRIEGKGRQHDFFCNVSPHTLRDEAFFGDFVSFLEESPELAAHLIFELSQADWAAQGDVERLQLDRLAGLGCRFSIDRLQSLDFDVEELAARRVRFVKVDAEWITDGDPDECHRAFAALHGRLQRRHIQLIVEKIEDEDKLLEVLDYGADLGQGFLFGEPKAARSAA